MTKKKTKNNNHVSTEVSMTPIPALKEPDPIPSIPVQTENRTESKTPKAEIWSFRKVILCGAVLLFLAWALMNLGKMMALLGKGVKIISPFIVGSAIAYILNVLMTPLEKLWDKLFSKKKQAPKKLKRGICLVLSIVLVIALLFAVLFMILPSLTQTVQTIIDNIPVYVEKLRLWWNSLSEFAGQYGAELPEFELDAKKMQTWLIESGRKFLTVTISATSSIFSAIFGLVLSFAFSIYLLSQKEKIGSTLKKWISAFVPEKGASRFFEITSLTNQTFTNFITGQLTEAVIIGVLCFVGMMILRIPYAAVCSVLVGFTALIPVVGAFVGTAIGAFLILLVSPVKAIWFVVFIVILQQLENNLIYPKVVGKSVGLPGILVLIAVTVGGSLFGMIGMLTGVPTAAVLYTLFKELVEKRLKKKKAADSPATS